MELPSEKGGWGYDGGAGGGAACGRGVRSHLDGGRRDRSILAQGSSRRTLCSGYSTSFQTTSFTLPAATSKHVVRATNGWTSYLLVPLCQCGKRSSRDTNSMICLLSYVLISGEQLGLQYCLESLCSRTIFLTNACTNVSTRFSIFNA